MRERVRFLAALVGPPVVILTLWATGVLHPVPYCETPYGVRDAQTCIAADGYPYRHGIPA